MNRAHKGLATRRNRPPVSGGSILRSRIQDATDDWPPNEGEGALPLGGKNGNKIYGEGEAL